MPYALPRQALYYYSQRYIKCIFQLHAIYWSIKWFRFVPNRIEPKLIQHLKVNIHFRLTHPFRLIIQHQKNEIGYSIFVGILHYTHDINNKQNNTKHKLYHLHFEIWNDENFHQNLKQMKRQVIYSTKIKPECKHNHGFVLKLDYLIIIIQNNVIEYEAKNSINMYSVLIHNFQSFD